MSLRMEWLQQPPETGNMSTDAKLRALAEYLSRTRINGDFPVSLWSHYNHVGPRTTNRTKGFHSCLNSRFGVPNPCLCTFINWLQKLQFEVQARMIQLQAGRALKARRQCYVDNNNRTWAAKQQYGTRGVVQKYHTPHAHNCEIVFFSRLNSQCTAYSTINLLPSSYYGVLHVKGTNNFCNFHSIHKAKQFSHNASEEYVHDKCANMSLVMRLESQRKINFEVFNKLVAKVGILYDRSVVAH